MGVAGHDITLRLDLSGVQRYDKKLIKAPSRGPATSRRVPSRLCRRSCPGPATLTSALGLLSISSSDGFALLSRRQRSMSIDHRMLLSGRCGRQLPTPGVAHANAHRTPARLKDRRVARSSRNTAHTDSRPSAALVESSTKLSQPPCRDLVGGVNLEYAFERDYCLRSCTQGVVRTP